MINHALTLLQNVAGDDFRLDRIGEEVLDPDYQPVSLPSHLLSVRRLLFGANPDREMLNYRSRQLMSLLHSCELADLVLDLDTLITYSFTDDPYYNQRIYVPQVYPQLTGTNSRGYASVIGQAGLPDLSGRMKLRWFAELLDTDTASVQPVGEPAVSLSYSVTSGLTSPIPLAGSGLSLLVRDSTFTPNNGPRFEIEVLRKPAIGCGQLLATAEQLGPEVLGTLFLGADSVWPLLRNYWQKHYDLAHRLGSLVLALIYRTEEIRTA